MDMATVVPVKTEAAPSFKIRIAPDGTIMERTPKEGSGMRWDWK